MQQTAEPLARELSKEVRSLKARLGARKLMEALAPGHPAAGDEVRPAAEGGAPDPAPDGSDLDLLWPPGHPRRQAMPGPRTVRDLDLDTVLSALAPGPHQEEREQVAGILGQMCDDPEVIRYRQEIVADLLAYPALAAGLEALLPAIGRLGVFPLAQDMPSLFQVTWWLGELETYVECVRLAGSALRPVAGDLTSAGLRSVLDIIDGVERDASFRDLVEELPDLLARMRGVASITVGINLDDELRPVAATLLAVSDEKFGEASLLRMLLGSAGAYDSVMPLHGVAGLEADGPNPLGRSRPNPMLIPLFRDLSRVMEQVSRPVAQALARYVHLHRGFWARLRPALAFYLGAVRLVRRLEAAGLPCCRPELASRAERRCEVEAGYNLNLALHLLDGGQADLRGVVVQNDVALNDAGRIAVLTGPNRGGKTTYTQSIGLIQVLAQAGLPVPAVSARLSPADNVYTHFPVEEELLQGSGRFGDEARRLQEVFGQATRYSLVLLNESLSGTHAGESLWLARDVVRACQLLGARVVFATHLHELAAQVDAINAETPGDSLAVSLVSSLIDAETIDRGAAEVAARRTYRVVPSPPLGRSYARELAMTYGISYEQLAASLAARGALAEPPEG